MAVTEKSLATWIVVIGEVKQIGAALPFAIQEEGWEMCALATLDAFLAAPRYPWTCVIVVIESFTIASLELIRNLTDSVGLPVIVTSLEHHPVMIRAALEAGAEDVMTIPVPIEELIARLRAIIRVRFCQHDWPNARPLYRLDDGTRSVSIDGGPEINLALVEYRVLKSLLNTPNQPVSRALLNEHLLPFTHSHKEGLLDVVIARLRRKVGAERLRTIRGVGYQLVDERRGSALKGSPTPEACG